MTTGVIPATGIQNGVLTASGNTDQVVAPCMSEILILRSTAHGFTVAYCDTSGSQVGSFASAAEISATCFEFRIVSGRNQPFAQNAVVALLIGTGSDVIAICPDRFPG